MFTVSKLADVTLVDETFVFTECRSKLDRAKKHRHLMELKTARERQMLHIALGVICLLYKQDLGPTRAEKRY